jgi:hypothetical protein
MEGHEVKLPGCIAVCAATILWASAAWCAGWSRGVTVTSLGELNVSGEVVQITIEELLDNSAHCSNPTGYALRDPATLKGSLALLTSALIAHQQVDLFVTGTCDPSGMPNVLGVILH